MAIEQEYNAETTLKVWTSIGKQAHLDKNTLEIYYHLLTIIRNDDVMEGRQQNG